MVPCAQRHAEQRAEHVGDDVEQVEFAAVGQQALEDFGAEAEAEGADEEGQVESASSRRVDHPVEDEGEDQEGEEVQAFVVEGEGKDGGCVRVGGGGG